MTDHHFYLEIRAHDGRLITQWVIPVGEDASEIDINEEIAMLRRSYLDSPTVAWADAILAGDS